MTAIIHRRDQFRAQPIAVAAAKANDKVEFVLDSVVDEILGDQKPDAGGKVIKLKMHNTKSDEKSELDVGAIFPFVGFLPNSNIFRDHVDHDEMGYLITDMNMATNIPGIFAAGDVRHQLTKQITTAVGDGTTAVVAAAKMLEERHHAKLGGAEKSADAASEEKVPIALGPGDEESPAVEPAPAPAEQVEV